MGVMLFHRFRDTRQQLQGSTVDESKTTLQNRMLKLSVSITALYFVCYTTLFCRIVFDLTHFLDFVYALNHIGNPIIYCLTSKVYYNDVMDTARGMLTSIRNYVMCRRG